MPESACFKEEARRQQLATEVLHEPETDSLLAKPVSIEASFSQHFGLWKHLKVLLGTSLAWFVMDVAFHGIDLNSSIVIGTIVLLGDMQRDDPCYMLTHNLLTVLYIVIGFGYHKILGASNVAFIVLFTLAQLFQNFGPNVTCFVWFSEVYLTCFRATVHGISVATGKLDAIVAQVGLM
ncbi:hypothetical protein IWW48_004528, partial [Coemansia sp. RSA 1200]